MIVGVLLAFLSPVMSGSAADRPLPVVTALTLDEAGLALTFDTPADVTIRHLDTPVRIVLDLPESGFAIEADSVVRPSTVQSLRFGRISEGRSRIVIGFSAPVWVVSQEGGSTSSARTTHRLSFSPVARDEFQSLVESDAAQIDTEAAFQSPSRSDAPNMFTLVIDPGHGGIDGGAEGQLGTIEKDLTLAFAKKLEAALAADPAIRVVLTRENDVFVSLRDRVQFARTHRADLLLSVHADSIDVPGLRGATIYTLSDSASDAVSSRLAAQENLADVVAGLPAEPVAPAVSDILIDLLKRETGSFSGAIARELIVQMERDGIRLINNPLRSAGFRVLTAPDVPSLLLEMGYLSNIEDEKLMREEPWRLRMAGVLAEAIRAYAKDHRLNAGAP